MIENYLEWLETNRKLSVSLFALLMLVLSIGAINLRFSTDFRVYLEEDDVNVMLVDEVAEKYSPNETLYVTISRKDSSPIDEEHISISKELTRKLWDTPNIMRVDSLSNYQIATSDMDGVNIEEFSDFVSLLESEEKISEIAVQEEQIVGYILSEDAVVSAVQVTLNLSSDVRTRMTQTPASVAHVRSIIEDSEEKYPDYRFTLGGSVLMNHVMGEAAINDVVFLVPICIVIIVSLLYFLLKSAWAVVATMMVVSVANIAAFSMLGWVDPIVAPIMAFVPNAIMVIAVADCVHIIKSYSMGSSSGLSKKDSLIKSYQKNTKPITVTTLTTVIGFLFLNFNESPPYQMLGNVIAFGTLFAYLSVMIVLPVMLMYLPEMGRRKSDSLDKILLRLGNFVSEKYKYVLFVFFVLIGPVSYFASMNILDDNWNNYFSERFDIRQDSDFINENISGLHRIDIDIDSGVFEGVYDEEYLESVDDFVSWLRGKDSVSYVGGITQLLSELNGKFLNTEPSLPTNESLSSQYMLMYEMSLPYGLDSRSVISFDKSSSKVTLVLKKMSSKELLAFVSEVDDYLKENVVPSGYSFKLSSLDVAFGEIAKKNTNSMIYGTALAFLSVSLVLVFVYKSASVGLLSLIPNVFPAFIAFALWYFLVGKVGLATSAVVSMAIGIIVDDTIHFISRYRYLVNVLRLSAQSAIVESYKQVGTAMTISTIVLSSGFLVLGFSPFEPTSHLGFLLSIVIFVALIFDLTVLPALILMKAKVFGLQYKNKGEV